MKAKRYHRDVEYHPYSQSIFLDSGAYGLYNIHVRKMVERIGKHGRELDVPKVTRGRGDFSYYTLKPGSEFRKYCDRYGRWLRMVESLGLENLLYVNIDVITNPKMTWEVQQYLEQEHGVHPVPVMHAGTLLEDIQRYLDTGRYPLIGLGGLGQNIGLEVYRKWADTVFSMICPASNKFLPIVKVHGFAMTSWEFICRWPWWSVDSATWVKLAAYGWLYISRWTERTGWDYDNPPLQINVSFRSPFLRKRSRHAEQKINGQDLQVLIKRWLKRCNLAYGEVHKEEVPLRMSDPLNPRVRFAKASIGDHLVEAAAPDFRPWVEIMGEVKEWGVQSHFAARAAANLHYLKDLEESRPLWPYPLDLSKVKPDRVNKTKGLGL